MACYYEELGYYYLDSFAYNSNLNNYDFYNLTIIEGQLFSSGLNSDSVVGFINHGISTGNNGKRFLVAKASKIFLIQMGDNGSLTR